MATFDPSAFGTARRADRTTFRLFPGVDADVQPVRTAMFDVLPSDRITRVVIHVFRESDHEHGPGCLALPDLPGFRACIPLNGN